ncbi:MAG: C40 family peptidase [Bacteroidales bacterium]
MKFRILPRGRFGVFFSFNLLLLLLSCSPTRNLSTQDREFYKQKGAQLGVKFEGYEDRAIIAASIEWLGVPYKYGGNSKKGIDCSALVYNIYKEAHRIKLNRPVSEMVKQVELVKKNKLQSGDLVFFSIKEKKMSHVGIYLGDYKFIHASTSQGVSIASLHNSYWKKYFSVSGRILSKEKTAKKMSKNRIPTSKTKKQDTPPLIIFDNEF